MKQIFTKYEFGHYIFYFCLYVILIVYIIIIIYVQNTILYYTYSVNFENQRKCFSVFLVISSLHSSCFKFQKFALSSAKLS